MKEAVRTKEVQKLDEDPSKGTTRSEPVIDASRTQNEGTRTYKTWSEAVTGRVPNSGSTNLGNRLKYYEPITDSNGKNAYIPEYVLDRSKQKWDNSLICYVFGPRPYYLHFKQFVEKMWKPVGGYELFNRPNGFFMLKCQCTEDVDGIMANGPYTCESRAIIVKKWYAGMTFNRDGLKNLPIWIRLHNLQLELWDDEPISRICSVIGTPLQLDPITTTVSRLSYARVLVNIDTTTQFPTEVTAKFSNGSHTKVDIQYEFKPYICKKCNLFGHTENKCSYIKQTWQPKHRNTNVNQNHMHVENFEDREKHTKIKQEYLQQKGSTKKSHIQLPNEGIEVQNSFECLSDLHGKEDMEDTQAEVRLDEDKLDALTEETQTELEESLAEDFSPASDFFSDEVSIIENVAQNIQEQQQQPDQQDVANLVEDNPAYPISEQEIKVATFSIDDSKSPGPDGFSAKFFKHH